MNCLRLKICGLRHPDQAQAIAALGITTLGFICVSSSPRYVTPEEIQTILASLPAHTATIGVFAHSPVEQIIEIVDRTGLTGIQLHGNESPELCQQLRQHFPDKEVIKALRIASPGSLNQAIAYFSAVNALLLDAYHPQQLGGTGKTLPWAELGDFQPPIPWFLAGGLTPDNVGLALEYLRPDGLDLSSGVETEPGEKDLEKVMALLRALG